MSSEEKPQRSSGLFPFALGALGVRKKAALAPYGGTTGHVTCCPHATARPALTCCTWSKNRTRHACWSAL
eukprot:3221337-Prymnesium_polylepis.1